MSRNNDSAELEELTELSLESPTLIEGLPGLGLVAAIAVEQVNKQLGLEHYGNIHSPSFPPVVSFQDGRFRDIVRVYAGSDPEVMTLQSDISVPPKSFDPLADCVINDLSEEFGRAVFLAGTPAENQEAVGEVFAAATTDGVERELRDAGVRLAEGSGVLSGVTGALVNRCYHEELPAAVLVVKSNPYIPDPTAAQSVIEDGLEPLVGFDVDTTELEEKADEIQRKKRQIAEQLKQQQSTEEPAPTGMYQ